MLTKYKNVRPKKGVKSPLKNVFMSAAYLRIFFREGAPKFAIYSRVFFGRVILKHIESKKGSKEVQGHAPRKFLKIYMLKWPF